MENLLAKGQSWPGVWTTQVKETLSLVSCQFPELPLGICPLKLLSLWGYQDPRSPNRLILVQNSSFILPFTVFQVRPRPSHLQVLGQAAGVAPPPGRTLVPGRRQRGRQRGRPGRPAAPRRGGGLPPVGRGPAPTKGKHLKDDDEDMAHENTIEERNKYKKDVAALKK